MSRLVTLEKAERDLDSNLVGLPLPRIDTRLKVTGKATYCRDLKLPSMLYAKIKRCPHPHARIKLVDTSEARSIQGVRTVIVGKDFPPPSTADTPPLAWDEVLYSNQAVAAVAAESPLIAEEALGFIDVQYQELPAVFDPELAMTENTPAIIKHPGEEASVPNVAVHLKVRHGDVDFWFEKADYIIQDEYTTGRDSHFQLEPVAYLAKADLDGGVTIWCTTSGAHVLQYQIANLLGINPYLVRVRVPFLGGWFGRKEDSHLAAICALLALKSSRPVKLELSREETMTATGSRHPAIIHVKDGLTSDGKVIAREVRAVYNGGAYSSMSNFAFRHTVLTAVSVYDIPNIKIDAYRVHTNTLPGTTKAGSFGLQMTFAIESQMDRISHELAIDAVKLRQKNILHDGRQNAIGETMESISYDKCLDEVIRRIGFGTKRPNSGTWKNGKGIALGEYSGSGGTYQAMVRVREKDRVEVSADIIENGAGIFTGIVQIVATEFGIPRENVVLLPFVNGTDSSSSGIAPGASASRQTRGVGNAILIACKNAKRQIAEKASEALRANVEEIDVRGGNVFVRAAPERSMKLSELFTQAPVSGTIYASIVEGGDFVGFGTFIEKMGSLDPEMGRCIGGPVSMYSVSMAQAADVSVNVETGQVRVNRIVAAMDAGKAINPQLIERQMIGMVTLSLSKAMCEDMVTSEGRIQNANLADYKILTSMDAPKIEPVIIETPDSRGPYGAKGCGDASTIPVAAAVRNAIHDAAGVWINDLPITPERVLDAIAKD